MRLLFSLLFSTIAIITVTIAIKVVIRACYGAYFVAHVFKYLALNFVSGRPA